MNWSIMEPIGVGTPVRVTRGYWKDRDGYVTRLPPHAPHDAKSLYTILVDRVHGIMPGNVQVQRRSLESLSPDPTPHSPPVVL